MLKINRCTTKIKTATYKAITISLLLVLAAAVPGCGTSVKTTEKTSTEPQNILPAKISIGIIQEVQNPVLDGARQGFLDTLAANGYIEGQNLSVDYQNAYNDRQALQAIAQKFTSAKHDVILAISTLSAVFMAEETKEIPILFTAVSDPEAANLVNSFQAPGANVTGTIDMNPVRKQLELIPKLIPSVKSVGIIYNPQEVNSRNQIKIVKDTAEELNISIVEANASAKADVLPASRSLCENNVDAICVLNDKTILSAASEVTNEANKNKIPVFSGQKSFVNAGGLAALSVDYTALGKQTGEMAFKILRGIKPQDIPVESPKNFEISINEATAKLLEIPIPDTLK